MKRRERCNLFGRACGVVAVVFAALWLTGQWWGELAAASPDGRWGLRKRGRGEVELGFSSEPAFHVYRQDEFDDDLGRMRRDLIVLGNWPAVMALMNEKGIRPQEYVAAQWSVTSERRGWAWWPSVTSENGPTTLIVPFWCLAVPFAVVAFVTERRQRQWVQRERTGRCPACNYDRTGIAADAVCPECGKAP